MGERKFFIVTAAIACAAVALVAGRSLITPPEVAPIGHAQTIPSSKMQQKLRESQGLLRSITYKDFGRIKEGAQKLSEISFEAQWSESTSPRYDMFSEEFRFNLEKMVTAAEEENLEAVTLSYVQVVMNCVGCHEEVREGEEIARLSNPEMQSLFQMAWNND